MATQEKKYLIFSLQNSMYALDLAQIAEVCDPLPMSPVPFVPDCYRGVLNLHGNIFAVTDLAILMGVGGVSKPGKMVVIHKTIASLAFLVDKVVTIVLSEEATFREDADNVFASAELSISGGKATLLDLDVLVSEAEMRIQKHR